MRLTVLLPLCCVLAVPAHAQHVAGVSGIHFNQGAPMAAPVNGYNAASFASTSRSPDVGRAQKLIADGDYAEADALLARLIGQTSNRQVRFLKGVAKLGMGDAVAARRYFEKSLYSNRSGYPGAMLGLALAEIRLGNRDAAEDILQKLRYQQEKCRSDCDRAKPLDQAIAVVEKALT